MNFTKDMYIIKLEMYPRTQMTCIYRSIICHLPTKIIYYKFEVAKFNAYIRIPDIYSSKVSSQYSISWMSN